VAMPVPLNAGGLEPDEFRRALEAIASDVELERLQVVTVDPATDVIVATVPDDTPEGQAYRLQALLTDRLGCRVVVKTACVDLESFRIIPGVDP